MFGDGAAARQFEASQSSEELIGYLQSTHERYQARVLQLPESAGFDAPSRDVILDQARLEVADRVAKFYDQQSREEIDQIRTKYVNLMGCLDEELLADASRDDAVSRRILTEAKDIKSLWQQATQEPDKH